MSYKDRIKKKDTESEANPQKTIDKHLEVCDDIFLDDAELAQVLAAQNDLKILNLHSLLLKKDLSIEELKSEIHKGNKESFGLRMQLHAAKIDVLKTKNRKLLGDIKEKYELNEDWGFDPVSGKLTDS